MVDWIHTWTSTFSINATKKSKVVNIIYENIRTKSGERDDNDILVAEKQWNCAEWQHIQANGNWSLGGESREATDLKKLMARVITRRGCGYEAEKEKFIGNWLRTVKSLGPCTRKLPFLHSGRRLKIWIQGSCRVSPLGDSRHWEGRCSVLKTGIRSQISHTAPQPSFSSAVRTMVARWNFWLTWEETLSAADVCQRLPSKTAQTGEPTGDRSHLCAQNFLCAHFQCLTLKFEEMSQT